MADILADESPPSWPCKQCTFLNGSDRLQCEMCSVVKHHFDNCDTSLSTYVCTYCLSINDLDIKVCIFCGKTRFLDLSTLRTSNTSATATDTTEQSNTSQGVDILQECPRCSVYFTPPLIISNNSNCEVCNYSFRPKYSTRRTNSSIICYKCKQVGHMASSCTSNVQNKVDTSINNTQCNRSKKYSTTSSDKNDEVNTNLSSTNSNIFTTGIIELLSNYYKNKDKSYDDAYLEENQSNNNQNRIEIIEYSLCSPCVHISQRGTEGYNWSCGYRNIQMMCYALLNHPTLESTYKSRLFNGMLHSY